MHSKLAPHRPEGFPHGLLLQASPCLFRSRRSTAPASVSPQEISKAPRRPPHGRPGGFTLIELLTVIAIIGILASIIIPTVSQVQRNARRALDGTNIRQIGHAALLYASENRDQLPKWTKLTSGTTFGSPSSTAEGESVDGFAAALAVSGGLNDASIWVSPIDSTTSQTNTGASTVLSANRQDFGSTPGNFTTLCLAYGVTLGLTSSDPATTPVAFSRGLLTGTNGKWDTAAGLYKEDGGHIAFLGGYVQFYRNLGSSDATGELLKTDGNRTWDIKNTIRGSRKMTQELITGASGTVYPGTGGS